MRKSVVRIALAIAIYSGASFLLMIWFAGALSGEHAGRTQNLTSKSNVEIAEDIRRFSSLFQSEIYDIAGAAYLVNLVVFCIALLFSEAWRRLDA